LARGFPQNARLKTAPEFQKVFNEGRKVVGRYFVVFARPRSPGRARLGLAVGRRVGNAVRRNFLKRLIRESFRNQQDSLDGMDLVVVTRGSAAKTQRAPLFRDLAQCWGRIRRG